MRDTRETRETFRAQCLSKSLAIGHWPRANAKAWINIYPRSLMSNATSRIEVPVEVSDSHPIGTLALKLNCKCRADCHKRQYTTPG